jgi:hypothetical protein
MVEDGRGSVKGQSGGVRQQLLFWMYGSVAPRYGVQRKLDESGELSGDSGAEVRLEERSSRRYQGEVPMENTVCRREALLRRGVDSWLDITDARVGTALGEWNTDDFGRIGAEQWPSCAGRPKAGNVPGLGSDMAWVPCGLLHQHPRSTTR